MTEAWFNEFEARDIDVGEVSLHARIGGSGPPLLLLHGYPQTHVCWHRVAPALTDAFTVVCPDLRGYGRSSKPKGEGEAERHLTYSKRQTAKDLVTLMAGLGFERFNVAGHDRGGRVAHRLALDHPDAIDRLAVLDIVPTRTAFLCMNQGLATAYYHWLFLIQPGGLPERMIGNDPAGYLRHTIASWSASGLDAFDPRALAVYEAAMSDPACCHAMCEDYRAAATIDLVHDEADLAVGLQAPLLALWGKAGVMERYFDVLATWRERHKHPDLVQGQALACGHFLPEELPTEVVAALRGHFGA